MFLFFINYLIIFVFMRCLENDFICVYISFCMIWFLIYRLFYMNSRCSVKI